MKPLRFRIWTMVSAMRTSSSTTRMRGAGALFSKSLSADAELSGKLWGESLLNRICVIPGSLGPGLRCCVSVRENSYLVQTKILRREKETAGAANRKAVQTPDASLLEKFRFKDFW